MWNTDNTGPHVETADAMYQSIPFLLTWHEGRACGLLFDDPGKTRFDLGNADPGAWRFEADGPGLRLFVIAGPTPADVLRRYAKLTGHMPLPPRWALGLHQSRWSYDSAQEVLEVAAEYRDRAIPADVIHLDIAYMDGYRVFTWDPQAFPDPATLTAKLAARGFRAVTIVDPGVKVDPGYAVYDGCRAAGLNVRMPDGTPFVGEVWPGECVFPDFSRVETRLWWGQHHQALVDAGVAGVWNDMNEPSVFRGPAVPRMDQTMPDEARHGAPGADVPHHQAHNLYGFHMSQATREGLLALRPNQRPFVISRAGYAGIQRHAMVWLGDNHSIWTHLETNIAMCLGMGLSGVPFVGPDVGGFMGDTEPELLVRWHQAGALTPFFRNHSALGTRRQEPWTFGEAVEALCRQAIELRYRLLPYVYTAFWACSVDGLPIMRPLWLVHPDDPATEGLHDQYYFGADLLVAPVTRPRATHRMVYFPAGRWICFHTGEVVEGPAHRVVDAPLDRLPLFGRAGAVLPLGPVRQSTDEELEVLTLRIFPGERLSGLWYDDDGLSLEHARGAFNAWRFDGAWGPGALHLALTREAEGYGSPTRRALVRLPVAHAPREVLFRHEPVAGWRHADGWLEIPLFMIGGALEVRW
jgi:alpha-glucosidase